MARKPTSKSQNSQRRGAVGSRLRAAVAEHQAGNLQAAEKIYEDVIKQDCNNADALHLLGLVHHQKNDNAQAGELIERAIKLRPDQAEFAYNLGKVRAAQERWTDSAGANLSALAVKPDYAAAHCNLGIALLWQGRPGAAEKSFRDAINYESESAPAWSGLGLSLRHQGNQVDADAAWERAIELQPDFAEAHYNLSTLRLAAKDFDRGWPGFGWRAGADPSSFDPQSGDVYPFSQPRWCGESLDQKNIFLWGEQGLGDQVLFAGLISELLEKGARIYLECEPRLVDLFKRSMPDITVIARTRPIPAKLSDAHIDVQCPLGDLGQYLRPNLTAFRHHDGYLVSDETKTSVLRSRYQEYAQGKQIIGISWRSPRKRFGALKSTDLTEDWGAILTTPNSAFVCLQYGPVDEALSRAADRHSVQILHDSGVDASQDIDALSAQISAMDLVISVSNTTVHLAGALNVPVWTLISNGAGRLWYWFDGQEDSPWYPSMRLFQQESPGDWSAVIARVGAELAAR